MNNIQNNSSVCFSVAGENQAFFDHSFTTSYESAIVYGNANLVTDEEKKKLILYKLCNKYLPKHIGKAKPEISKHLSQTAVCEISMDIVTGKTQPFMP